MGRELEEIKKVYYELNARLDHQTNTPETRNKVIQTLLHSLEKTLDVMGIMIRCDEENNPPDVITNNQLIARVEWRMNKFEETVHYIDLTFGDVEVVWDQTIK